jgi:hypothetical protein
MPITHSTSTEREVASKSEQNHEIIKMICQQSYCNIPLSSLPITISFLHSFQLLFVYYYKDEGGSGEGGFHGR